MSRAAVELVVYLMDDAFEGVGESPTDRAQSLLANLHSLRDDDWLWLPAGGGRSIFDIVRHIGECKYVYDNHAFGDGSMGWDKPGTVPTVEPGAPKAAVIDWLREGHRRWRESIADLDDAELLKRRRDPWGQVYENRWLIAVMIEHDSYHAGEINHIRALRQGDDRWAWESP